MPAAAGARGPILDAPRPGATGFRLGRHPRIKPDVPCEKDEAMIDCVDTRDSNRKRELVNEMRARAAV